MKRVTGKIHMAINVRGMLNFYRRRSMARLIKKDDGSFMTDEEARNYLYDHIAAGHVLIPCCDPSECPDFDYMKHGCQGHDVHYYDDDDNEITKEQYENLLNIKSNEQ